MTEKIQEAIHLLKSLISTPSISREEDKTAKIIVDFLHEKEVITHQYLNNIWAVNKYFDDQKPTILLNSHHDTVKPNKGYTLDPFTPIIKDEKLFGLGSNDAGGCLVSLVATFLHYYHEENLNYNLCLAASAEEEISGKNGIEILYPQLPTIDFAIIGEPTLLDAAIAEKGLMVLDCVVKGKSGHAAREEGENALYKALSDIEWFKSFQFPKVSEQLGPVKMSVTVIKSGTQHNVVPDLCEFVVDVRTTNTYSNIEILNIIQEHVDSKVTPRSTRLNPSSISKEHPVVLAAKKYGSTCYGSPTMSDQALLPVPSLKMGPGDSARSHSADEYIFLEEIERGILHYIQVLKEIL